MGYKLKRILMWVNNATRGLPAEYQEVEYIESTGTQYIDTGVSAPNGFKSQLKICITGQVGQTLIGSHNVNSPYGRNNINTYTSGATWGLHMNDEMINGLGSIVIGQDCEIEMSTILGASYLTVDGIRLTNGTNTSPMSANNILILQNQYGIAHGDGCNKAKIYYCKIYDSSETLVRDFVPCYRKADDIIGLYDLVNDQFYTNAGTGTFTKGADIPDMLEKQVRPKSKTEDFYFSGNNFNEFQGLVDDIGSIQFVDTGLRFRFNPGVYVGNRVAIDFDGSTMRKINLDTLSVISTVSSNVDGQVWYFGDGRILTRKGIIDTDGTYITQFASTFDSVSPGDTGVVWANIGYDIYKGEVNGDNIAFSKIGTGGTDQMSGGMCYGYLGAYLLNYNDTYGGGYSSYINISNDNISNFSGGSDSRDADGFAGADGKLYRLCIRYNGWGRLQKIGTGDEGFVGTSLNTGWTAYGRRYVKFLGNIVSGGMNSNNGTGTGYGSNSYFIDSSGNLSLVQSNALAYDTDIRGKYGFIDEKGYIYPYTRGGGSGVILKTDKTFTNLNRKNPYLWR